MEKPCIVHKWELKWAAFTSRLCWDIEIWRGWGEHAQNNEMDLYDNPIETCIGRHVQYDDVFQWLDLYSYFYFLNRGLDLRTQGFCPSSFIRELG